MQAIVVRELGPPEVLVAEEVDDPVAGPGEVVVRASVANVTFVETQLRAGRGPFPVEPPYVPGNGVGGVVAAAGADVDPALVGRRVVTATGGAGGYAELAAVPAAGLFEVPDGVELADAVAVLADGRTATMLVDAISPVAGLRVLVEAAAGGVGTLSVQLLASAGAMVVGAVGGDRKLEVAQAAGAALVVDYSRPGWTDAVREQLGGVDAVLDGVGGDLAAAAFELVEPGGSFVSFGLASGTWADLPDELLAERGVQRVRPAPTPDELRSLTERALRSLADGTLRPVVGQRFPLASAAAAHAAIESRATVGKTLLDVG